MSSHGFYWNDKFVQQYPFQTNILIEIFNQNYSLDQNAPNLPDIPRKLVNFLLIRLPQTNQFVAKVQQDREREATYQTSKKSPRRVEFSVLLIWYWFRTIPNKHLPRVPILPPPTPTKKQTNEPLCTLYMLLLKCSPFEFCRICMRLWSCFERAFFSFSLLRSLPEIFIAHFVITRNKASVGCCSFLGMLESSGTLARDTQFLRNICFSKRK